MRASAPAAQRGFTLVELVMVITMMGVIGGIVAVFMRSPVDAYFSAARRAALSDQIDTTVRRITRDLHRAVPNTVRTSGGNCLEFIPAKTGARYRAEGTGALVFNTSVGSFNMLGDASSFAGGPVPADQQMAVGDRIVVYNLGISGADAYAQDNTATITSVGSASGGETPIGISPKQFPLASASMRFHVVDAREQMVSYVCSGNTLYRTASALPTATASCPALGARIASPVDCANSSFTVTDAGNALGRNALVSLRLTLQDSTATESVTLQHQVHVDNTP